MCCVCIYHNFALALNDDGLSLPSIIAQMMHPLHYTKRWVHYGGRSLTHFMLYMTDQRAFIIALLAATRSSSAPISVSSSSLNLLPSRPTVNTLHIDKNGPNQTRWCQKPKPEIIVISRPKVSASKSRKGQGWNIFTAGPPPDFVLEKAQWDFFPC